MAVRAGECPWTSRHDFEYHAATNSAVAAIALFRTDTPREVTLSEWGIGLAVARWVRLHGRMRLSGFVVFGLVSGSSSWAESGPVRQYVFEGSERLAVFDSRSGGGGAAAYEPAAKGPQAGGLEWVAGRDLGSKVPRLDAGALSAAPFDVGTNGFTVSMWFRVLGPGTLRGNPGSENGTLFSVGSGYWDGVRLTTDCRRKTVSFEIGQAKPLHSVGVSGGRVVEGAWQHAAASWDGGEMRLYLDGLLVAAGRHGAAYVKPAGGAKMRVGFAGHGVGSVVLDVAEVAVHGRALAAAEVLCWAFRESVEGGVAARLAAAGEAMAGGDAAGAEVGFGGVLGEGKLTPGAKVIALRGLAGARLALARPGEATAAWLDMLRVPGAGPDAMALARAGLLEQVKDGAAGEVPAEVLEGLLGVRGLAGEDRIAVLRQLVVRQCEAGNFAEARRACEGWLAAAAAGSAASRDAILAMGHVAMEAGNFAGARDAYGKLARDGGAPAPARALAMIRVAESLVREGKAGEATAALREVSKIPGVPGHLAEEAAARAQEATGGNPWVALAGPMAAPQWPAAGLTLFVATNGSDAAAGTAEAPFASLGRARDEIRSRRAKAGVPQGGVRVVIRAGEFVVTNALQLGKGDSGEPGAPIVYLAAEGERPRFRGGVRIGGFAAVRDRGVLSRLPEEARGKVVVADLGASGVKDYGKFDPGGYASGGGFGTRPLMELYWDGEPMRVARWPNEGWARAGEMLGEPTKDSRGRPVWNGGAFHFDDSRAGRWLQEKEAFLYGYWYHDWADSYDRVARIDAKEKVIELAAPLHRYGYRGGARFRAVNLLSEIDLPGEYFVDRSAGKVYLLPRTDPATAVAEVPLMEGAFLELDGVSHVAFEGLTWELGRGDGLRVKGGEGVLLAGCTVRAFGGDGVILDGGKGHGLLSCEIAHLGRGGIVLRGGDRRTLDPGGHFVENCHVHHFSRIHPTYTPAVHASGVGARIRHNLMHDSGSSALRIEGNEHLVEFNEVHHVVTESDDQGGIDMWGNPTYRGNVFRWNAWRHIGHEFAVGQAGIRLDDAISGTLIYGNVFYRTGGGHFGGVQIHGGKDNIVDNNIFIECPYAVSFSPWGEKRWLETLDRPDFQRRIRQEVDIGRPPYSDRYPELANLREGADANRIWRNVVVNCGGFLFRDRGIHELVDNVVASEGPEFFKVGRGGMRLKSDAAIFRRTAFWPIPFAEIGLYRDRYREDLPRRGDGR